MKFYIIYVAAGHNFSNIICDVLLYVLVYTVVFMIKYNNVIYRWFLVVVNAKLGSVSIYIRPLPVTPALLTRPGIARRTRPTQCVILFYHTSIKGYLLFSAKGVAVH